MQRDLSPQQVELATALYEQLGGGNVSMACEAPAGFVVALAYLDMAVSVAEVEGAYGIVGVAEGDSITQEQLHSLLVCLGWGSAQGAGDGTEAALAGPKAEDSVAGTARDEAPAPEQVEQPGSSPDQADKVDGVLLLIRARAESPEFPWVLASETLHAGGATEAMQLLSQVRSSHLAVFLEQLKATYDALRAVVPSAMIKDSEALFQARWMREQYYVILKDVVGAAMSDTLASWTPEVAVAQLPEDQQSLAQRTLDSVSSTWTQDIDQEVDRSFKAFCAGLPAGSVRGDTQQLRKDWALQRYFSILQGVVARMLREAVFEFKPEVACTELPQHLQEEARKLLESVTRQVAERIPEEVDKAFSAFCRSLPEYLVPAETSGLRTNWALTGYYKVVEAVVAQQLERSSSSTPPYVFQPEVAIAELPQAAQARARQLCDSVTSGSATVIAQEADEDFQALCGSLPAYLLPADKREMRRRWALQGYYDVVTRVLELASVGGTATPPKRKFEPEIGFEHLSPAEQVRAQETLCSIDDDMAPGIAEKVTEAFQNFYGTLPSYLIPTDQIEFRRHWALDRYYTVLEEVTGAHLSSGKASLKRNVFAPEVSVAELPISERANAEELLAHISSQAETLLPERVTEEFSDFCDALPLYLMPSDKIQMRHAWALENYYRIVAGVAEDAPTNCAAAKSEVARLGNGEAACASPMKRLRRLPGDTAVDGSTPEKLVKRMVREADEDLTAEGDAGTAIPLDKLATTGKMRNTLRVKIGYAPPEPEQWLNKQGKEVTKYLFGLTGEKGDIEGIAWGLVAVRAASTLPAYKGQCVLLSCVQYSVFQDAKTGRSVPQAKLGAGFSVSRSKDTPLELEKSSATLVPLKDIGSLADWAKTSFKGIIHEVLDPDEDLQIVVLRDARGNTLCVRMAECHAGLDLAEKVSHELELYNVTVSRRYRNVSANSSSVVCVSASLVAQENCRTYQEISWPSFGQRGG